jgi:hypothetical protein
MEELFGFVGDTTCVVVDGEVGAGKFWFGETLGGGDGGGAIELLSKVHVGCLLVFCF